jgi:hypothetical protein
MRADDQRYHGAAEQAGPGLLHAEANKFIEERRDPALLGSAPKPYVGGDEAGERRPLRGGTFGRPNWLEIVQAA